MVVFAISYPDGTKHWDNDGSNSGQRYDFDPVLGGEVTI